MVDIKTATDAARNSSTAALTVHVRGAAEQTPLVLALVDSYGLSESCTAVTSAGAKDCSGQAEGYRLETAAARAFLGTFAALP